MTYQPREGDHVRVVLEGKVSTSHPEGFWLSHTYWLGRGWSHVKSVERIDPPEDWQPGDVVLDDDGDVFLRKADIARPGYWQGFAGICSDDAPERPLTLIARGGKPVAS